MIKYKVRRITEQHRMCTFCKGTSHVRINLGGGNHKMVSCSTCLGTGVAKFEHLDEIDLIDALEVLGFKVIEVTN
jgi:hypothetical protein